MRRRDRAILIAGLLLVSSAAVAQTLNLGLGVGDAPHETQVGGAGVHCLLVTSTATNCLLISGTTTNALLVE